LRKRGKKYFGKPIGSCDHCAQSANFFLQGGSSCEAPREKLPRNRQFHADRPLRSFSARVIALKRFVSTNGLRRKTQLSRNQSPISHLVSVRRARRDYRFPFAKYLPPYLVIFSLLVPVLSFFSRRCARVRMISFTGEITICTFIFLYAVASQCACVVTNVHTNASPSVIPRPWWVHGNRFRKYIRSRVKNVHALLIL